MDREREIVCLYIVIFCKHLLDVKVNFKEESKKKTLSREDYVFPRLIKFYGILGLFNDWLERERVTV